MLLMVFLGREILVSGYCDRIESPKNILCVFIT